MWKREWRPHNASQRQLSVRTCCTVKRRWAFRTFCEGSAFFFTPTFSATYLNSRLAVFTLKLLLSGCRGFTTHVEYAWIAASYVHSSYNETGGGVVRRPKVRNSNRLWVGVHVLKIDKRQSVLLYREMVNVHCGCHWLPFFLWTTVGCVHLHVSCCLVECSEFQFLTQRTHFFNGTVYAWALTRSLWLSTIAVSQWVLLLCIHICVYT